MATEGSYRGIRDSKSGTPTKGVTGGGLEQVLVVSGIGVALLAVLMTGFWVKYRLRKNGPRSMLPTRRHSGGRRRRRRNPAPATNGGLPPVREPSQTSTPHAGQ